MYNPEKRKMKYENNKARVLLQQKEYRDAHKAERLIKRQVKYVCACGDELMEHSKTKHLKSMRHIERTQ